jgi:hypothetical protein
MNIEKLEYKLLKSSKIEDGDVLLVKIDPEEKKKFDKNSIKSLYDDITKMIGKSNVSIYFFPKNIDIELIKNHVTNIERSKDKLTIEEDSNEKNINLDVNDTTINEPNS